MVEVGECFGVVETGVVQDDCDPGVVGFSLELVQGEDDLFGVLVSCDWIQFHSFAGLQVGIAHGATDR